MRFVVEAVPLIVTAVDEAYGNIEAVEVVAMKYPARAELPRADDPSTLNFAYGVVEPMPTLPVSKTEKFSTPE